ncbi:MAG: methyltransferase domain-containing protein [Planctomycetes bacterium]|jgi:SAM-dependent methyltransferase|nr:methyltransferase domain-containing protein [Planctomycetota bacterium]
MTRQWTAEEILALGRSFQPACVLAAAADLDLYGAIGEGEATAGEIARRVRGKTRGVTILLDALAALSLLDKRGDRYAVPPSLRKLLVADHPESLLAMTQHQANCLRRWAQLARTIRDGKPVEVAPSVRGADGDRASFIEAMDNISRAAAPPLVAELMPIRFTRLLDIGGGSGTWTIAWLRANEEARATLFDLPPVIPLARDRLERAGLLDRVDLVAGDFYEDPLPGGADLALLSAIVHQNSRRENRALFRKTFAALVPGGRLLVRDVVMDATRTKPPAGALFAVNMLSATEAGGTFTLGELRDDLAAAGFANVKQLRKDEWMHSVVTATHPRA